MAVGTVPLVVLLLAVVLGVILVAVVIALVAGRRSDACPPSADAAPATPSDRRVERRRVLDMLDAGEIDAAEAERLLAALNEH